MGYFSENYQEARRRFIDSANKAGGTLWQYSLDVTGPKNESLSIDICRIGPQNAAKSLIVSSGTHGIEGFFGSAVQLACLNANKPLPKDVAVIMIHAINPYGFSHLRRVNEDNVDLNRNFIHGGDQHTGSHPDYAKFNPLLNREKPPGRFEFFQLRALYNITIHGLSNLKNAIAQGQYDYPYGIFFGGKKATQSQKILNDHFHEWVGDANEIIHLDLHTGLGKKGTYVLGIGGEMPRNEQARWRDIFGKDKIATLESGGELYTIRGEFGSWCQSHFQDKNYAAFLAEFGTYPILQVIKALCEENRATHWGESGPKLSHYRNRLKEVFAPKSQIWREEVVQKGLNLIEQALKGLDSINT